MAEFKPTDAAFAGFRLVREQPVAILAWAAVIAVGRICQALLTAVLAGPYMAALNAAVNAKIVDPQATASAYAAVAPGYVAGALVMLPFAAVVTTAIYRAYLRPEQSRGLYLRLGRAERAMIGLFLALGLTIVLAGFGLLVLIGLGSALVAAADATAGQVASLTGLFAAIGVLIFAVVRLSLAWPMTFEQERVVLVRAWPLIKGKAWPVLGGFVIAEALMGVVALLLLAIVASLVGAALLMTGGTLQQIADLGGEIQAPGDLLRPLTIVFIVVQALLLALSAATIEGVRVTAYRAFSA
jgi:hypothetical protein